MFTSWWLTFTALLVGSATGRGTLTFAPTCRVKGRPEVELTLTCGDGKRAGVVQYWHTPFGDLRTPGFRSNLDPVFMNRDGSLLIRNSSVLHSGLYYCLLQHAEGTTLSPYELHVHKQSGAAFRLRRDVGSEAGKQGGVSDEQLAGAVVASVLLTFVLGFSAGALTRNQVLRCLAAVSTRVRSPRKQRCQTDNVSDVTLTTVYNNQAFEMDPVSHCATMETTISSSSLPAKPQRSFRHKRGEEQETDGAYLEGCGDVKEERKEEEAGGRVEEKSNRCDKEEDVEFSGFYLRGETDEAREEKDGERGEERMEEKQSREERMEEKWSREDAEEEKQSREERMEEKRSREDAEEEKQSREERMEEKQSREDAEEERDEQDGDTEKREEEEDTEMSGDSARSSTETEDAERSHEDTAKSDITEDPSSSSTPRPTRRVIRLYQYDEDGQRYRHLPDPSPNDPGPAPRLKQRSLSLTRLSVIMAAAAASPLDGTQKHKASANEEWTV